MAFYDAHLLKTARNLEAREELFNLSIVVARTKEGTLVRKVDALELITVPDLEMPIGAYAWQNRFNQMIGGERKEVHKWRYTVDEEKYTFRHFDFALPVRVNYRGEFKFGDFGSSKFFPNIGSLYTGPHQEYMYIVPRELVHREDLKKFDTSILWFFSSNQRHLDSVDFNPGKYVKTYAEYLPKSGQYNAYGLCSHRTDSLTLYNGYIEIEKNKRIEIGKWYTCQYNQKIVQKCTSIQPFEGQPVATYTQKYMQNGKEKTLVLCRDFIKTPVVKINNFKEQEQSGDHPLIYRINVYLYCAFAQKEGVEICFARPEYVYPHENKWQIVAVSRGPNNMCWLPKLGSQFDGILRKEEFSFIKTINEMEAEHYYRTLSSNDSLDKIHDERAEWFKNFPSIDITKEDVIWNNSLPSDDADLIEELVIGYPENLVPLEDENDIPKFDDEPVHDHPLLKKLTSSKNNKSEVELF